MKKLHEKSPCCRGKINRFGGRRRQCCVCKKTWSVWKKKRGRKQKRVSERLVVDYLNNLKSSAYAQEKYNNKRSRNINRDLEKSRDLFCRKTKWSKIIEKDDLILVADAKVKLINKKWYTLHIMLIRSVNESQAVILPSILSPGAETQISWRKALNTINIDTKKRIKTMVCDGHRGLVNYAKQQRWLIQRCYFHLISSIQGRRSRWSRSNHRAEGILIHNLVTNILKNPNEKEIEKSLLELESLAFDTKSVQLKRILLGFISSYEDYRNYIYHPDLNLPNTNNTAESLNSCIQNLLNKSNGFRSVKSFEKWIEALTKNKKKIACRPAKNQQSFCL